MPLGWRKARPSKVTPRANARSESGSDRRRGVAAGGYWSRLGRGLLISLRVVATVTVLVGGCSGLFVLARELGPLTREWFLVRSVSVNGLHHVTRKEVIGRLALKPDTALYSINPTWLADRVKTHPWIKDATVVLKPLHEIHIDIVEREPRGAHVFTEDGVEFALADLTQAEYDGYYLGYANRALWPVFHYRIDLAQFEEADFAAYEAVNRRFGSSTLMFLRLFSRAPWTRMRSWLSAGCGAFVGICAGYRPPLTHALPLRLRPVRNLLLRPLSGRQACADGRKPDAVALYGVHARRSRPYRADLRRRGEARLPSQSRGGRRRAAAGAVRGHDEGEVRVTERPPPLGGG